MANSRQVRVRGWIPFESFRDLEGVVWNCPACGTSRSMVFRTRHTPYRRYWFRCGDCHYELEVNSIVAENLAIALGAPARRGRPPVVRAWIDEDGNAWASIDGKEHPVGTSAQLAALEEERSREL